MIWSVRKRSRNQGPRPNVAARARRSFSRRWGIRLVRRTGKFVAVTVLVGIVIWGAMIGYREAAPHVAKWFAVREITVSGANQVTRREVLERLALTPNETLLSLNARRLAIRLESHPWIKHATISRVLPHTVAVQIVERRAAAVLRAPSMTLLLDDEGHALSILPTTNDPGLPVLVGINPKGVLGKEAQPLQAAQRGIELASLLERTFDGRPEVDVANPENAVAYVEGLRLQFGASPFQEKWDRYQKVEQYLPAGGGHARGEGRNDIDLRYPGKVIVRDRG
jgi:cell division protein FtsQ